MADDPSSIPPALPPELREPGVLARLRGHAIDLTPLRASREFRLLFAGQAVSEFGSNLTFVAVPFQVYQITNSTLAVGLLGLCELAPLLVLPLLGGAIADATERRKLLIVSHALTALLSVALAVNALAPHPHLWVLYVFSFLAASAYSLYSPAIRAWPARLIAKELLPSAMALEAAYYNVASLAGPALAGILIYAVGLPGVYLLDVATFGAAVVAGLFMQPSPPTDAEARVDWATMRAGLRFLKGKRVLQGTFYVDLNAMIFGMPFALFPAMAKELGGGSQLLGFLYAAPAAGSLLASLLSGRAKHVHRQGLAIMLAVIAWGATIAGVGLSEWAGITWLVLLLLAAAGAADMVSGIYRDTVLKTVTPDEMRGRVEGVSLSIVAAGPALGNVEAGVVAYVWTVPASIVSGGVLCVAGVGVLALALPSFARYDARHPAA